MTTRAEKIKQKMSNIYLVEYSSFLTTEFICNLNFIFQQETETVLSIFQNPTFCSLSYAPSYMSIVGSGNDEYTETNFQKFRVFETTDNC